MMGGGEESEIGFNPFHAEVKFSFSLESYGNV
jgi:hypothetical protein